MVLPNVHLGPPNWTRTLKPRIPVLVMAAPRLYVPNRLHHTVPYANEPVPAADHGVLLARNQQDLVADFQGRPATYSENYPVPIHFSDDDAGRVFHAWKTL